jgi:ribonucleoside-diphosphate reductase alpha chain
MTSRRKKMANDLIEPVMSDNAKYIVETRYAMKGEDGKPVESVGDVFWRVAKAIAEGDRKLETRNEKLEEKILEQTKVFYELMVSQKFFPNTPCLVNAGKKHQQLSACFVLPIEDSMDSILETMSDMAKIHKSGGGTGFSFSRLRPYGDYIVSSGGTTVGPVSFMQAYNDVTSQIKQGGVRRGANMGMLSIDHPDVLRFAVVKLDEYSLTNFNISVAVTNKFMEQVELDKKFAADDDFPEEIVEEIRKAEAMRDVDLRLRTIEQWVAKLYDWAAAKHSDEGYRLMNPRTGEVAGKLNANKVFNLVTRLAWQYGDPGVVFIDRMNEPSSNPVPALGRIEATNPCGEQPLLPYDACNLGSINVSKFVKLKSAPNHSFDERRGENRNNIENNPPFFKGGNGEAEGDLDWQELRRVVYEAVHFLDNIVEVNDFPVQKIREMVNKTRRIGLGIMGFADMLFKLGVRYDSEQGIMWAEKVMKFIQNESKSASVELAKSRGVFPAWDISVFAKTNYRPRNMALTTIAPTGTISYIADATSGIEPAFSLGYQKNNIEGNSMFMLNSVFVEDLKKRNIYTNELLEKIVKNGGKLTGIEGLPEDLRDIYRTAMEISPEWHVRIQAAFQKYTDNAVSKTINFPKTATVEEVRRAYTLAYSLGTKGITIYRSGSREKEVIAPVKQEETSNIKHQTSKQKKRTPEAARGVRLRKTCDVGKVYTSVFFEEGDGPVEVFVNLGKSGGYMAGASEVTGRLASLALKYGASLNEVADELVGVSCGQKVGMGPSAILSMFDAVGKSLLEVSKGEQLEMFEEEKEKLNLHVGNGKSEMSKEQIVAKVSTQKDVLAQVRVLQAVEESKFISCPDCGSPLYAEEGCFKCANAYCGYSKCS